MSINYGSPANPEAFIIATLLPLGWPVGPERDESTGLPSYVVTAAAGRGDRFMLEATVSVHSYAATRAEASALAWDADSLLLSRMPGDLVTLPDGSVVGAWVDPHTPPAWVDYHDPFIKRYVARYDALLRFTP